LLVDFKVSACHVFILLAHALADTYAGSLPFGISRRLLSKVTNVRQTCHGRVGRTCVANSWMRLCQERQHSIEIQPIQRKIH